MNILPFLLPVIKTAKASTECAENQKRSPDISNKAAKLANTLAALSQDSAFIADVSIK